MQVGAVDVAHRDVQPAALGAGVQNGHDVRMVDRCGDPALALEASTKHGIARVTGGDQFESDSPIECQVGRPVHNTHATAACDGIDPVPGERGADREVLVGSGRAGGSETRAQARVEVGDSPRGTADGL